MSLAPLSDRVGPPSGEDVSHIFLRRVLERRPRWCSGQHIRFMAACSKLPMGVCRSN